MPPRDYPTGVAGMAKLLQAYARVQDVFAFSVALAIRSDDDPSEDRRLIYIIGIDGTTAALTREDVEYLAAELISRPPGLSEKAADAFEKLGTLLVSALDDPELSPTVH
jgi:hypothetical protein